MRYQLTDVIEKETYKRANELLNQFDPNYEFRNEYENDPQKKLKATTEHNSDTECAKPNLTKKPKPISGTMKAVSISDLRQHDSQHQKSSG